MASFLSWPTEFANNFCDYGEILAAFVDSELSETKFMQSSRDTGSLIVKLQISQNILIFRVANYVGVKLYTFLLNEIWFHRRLNLFHLYIRWIKKSKINS